MSDYSDLEDRIESLESEVAKLKNVSMLLQMAERMNHHYSRQKLSAFSPIFSDFEDEDANLMDDTKTVNLDRPNLNNRPAPQTADEDVETTVINQDNHDDNTSTKPVTDRHDLTEDIFNRTGNPIMILDSEGRILHFNRACQHLSGYEPYEVRDRHYWDVLIPEIDRKQVRIDFQQRLVIRLPQPPYTTRWERKDNQARFIMWSDTILRDSNDKIDHIISTGIHIARKHELLELPDTSPVAPSAAYTPIIAVSDHIVSVALVGTIDATRTLEIIHDVRDYIKHNQIRIVILDIGRIDVLTATTARHIRHIMQAAHLLDTYAVVTRTPDAAAETILNMDVNWENIKSRHELSRLLKTSLDKLGIHPLLQTNDDNPGED